MSDLSERVHAIGFGGLTSQENHTPRTHYTHRLQSSHHHEEEHAAAEGRCVVRWYLIFDGSIGRLSHHRVM